MRTLILVRRRRDWWHAILLAALLCAMFLAVLRAEAFVHSWFFPSFVDEISDTLVAKVSGASVVSFNFERRC